MKTKLALSAFVAAFVLSACGSKTEAPAPAADTTPPPAATPAPDAAASAASDSAAAASAPAHAASSPASAASAPPKQSTLRSLIPDPSGRTSRFARSVCLRRQSGIVARQYPRLQTFEE